MSIEHGRHELSSDEPAQQIGDVRPHGKLRRPTVFGVLAVILCLVLGAAIATQVRRTESGDTLESARPADLVTLLDSLRQREASLTNQIADLQRTLAALKASGTNDQAAIADAQSRLTALSILVGTVAATGPGVTLSIGDAVGGVSPEVMIDVINELRAAGAEAIEVSAGSVAVRVGVDTSVGGGPGALSIDGQTLSPPYSVTAIGDPPTLAAALNIPGGAIDSVERVGATVDVRQSDHVNVTALRQPKPRQYAHKLK
jgi:uncharacterized protein YlxW (UPF0749 family)